MVNTLHRSVLLVAALFQLPAPQLISDIMVQVPTKHWGVWEVVPLSFHPKNGGRGVKGQKGAWDRVSLMPFSPVSSRSSSLFNEVVQMNFEIASFSSLSGTQPITWQVEYPRKGTTDIAVSEIFISQKDLVGIVPLAMVSVSLLSLSSAHWWQSCICPLFQGVCCKCFVGGRLLPIWLVHFLLSALPLSTSLILLTLNGICQIHCYLLIGSLVCASSLSSPVFIRKL
jgi:hypothetical protein